ncbi:MAG: hypothetical protein JNM80_07445 [Phycisphaerae bacterium]|nr:hypothetical protein [Phycisphaerae bacterium]
MTHAKRQLGARGITLVEAVLSMAVASVMLAASLNAVAAARVGQVWNTQRLAAMSAASALMTEITDLAYQEPLLGGGLGPDALEVDRTLYDDVDDYAGYKAACADRSGKALPGTSRMRFVVDVEWVEPASPGATVGAESGVKRITVRVERDGKELARLAACRSEMVER